MAIFYMAIQMVAEKREFSLFGRRGKTTYKKRSYFSMK